MPRKADLRIDLINGLVGEAVTARGFVCGDSEPVRNPGVRVLPTCHYLFLAKHQNEREGEIEILHTPPENDRFGDRVNDHRIPRSVIKCAQFPPSGD